jgi:hypothetical protein
MVNEGMQAHQMVDSWNWVPGWLDDSGDVNKGDMECCLQVFDDPDLRTRLLTPTLVVEGMKRLRRSYLLDIDVC